VGRGFITTPGGGGGEIFRGLHPGPPGEASLLFTEICDMSAVFNSAVPDSKPSRPSLLIIVKTRNN